MDTNTATQSSTADTRRALGVSEYLIVVFHAARPGAACARIALGAKRRVRLGRGSDGIVEQQSTGDDATVEVQLPDRRVSMNHAVLEPRDDRWFIADLDSKNGTTVNGVDVTRRVLRDGDLIELGDTFLFFREVDLAVDPHDHAIHTVAPSSPPEPLATMSPALEQTFRELRQIAPTGRAVLLTGETGTGKELTARALHELSGRAGPFVAVNCASIPATLVESSFFGVRKGAFSGATQERDGWVRAADGGTLFLDEVAELSEPSQAALLRVLQEGEVVPVGGTRAVAVDVRFVAATHQDLKSRVAAGLFREDVYARLAAHCIHLPALRERKEDMGLLAGCSFARGGDAVSLRHDVVRALFSYDWPRNVRELDNVLAHARTLADGGEIELSHVPQELQPLEAPRRAAPDADLADADTLRRKLVELYRRHDGNVSAVARELGKARMQIQRWNKRFNLDPSEFKA